jgi:hypothetical protein
VGKDTPPNKAHIVNFMFDKRNSSKCEHTGNSYRTNGSLLNIQEQIYNHANAQDNSIVVGEKYFLQDVQDIEQNQDQQSQLTNDIQESYRRGMSQNKSTPNLGAKKKSLKRLQEECSNRLLYMGEQYRLKKH